MTTPLLEVENLSVVFGASRGLFGRRGSFGITAVNDISFSVRPGETLGVVGESGCGKSTAGRASISLQPRTAGTIRYKGTDISSLPNGDFRQIQRNMQMVFQDPMSSLTPHFTVERLLAEPIKVHGLRPGKAVRARVNELLELVGLNPAHASRYPHQFSGGQRQRIGIARALAVEPALLVCDEAVSALDVSVQAQVVNLLEDLQKELGLTYIFISHGLSIVQHISDRIAVMYLGRIVEVAEAEELGSKPMHPYTQALLSAVPVPDPLQERHRKRIILTGDVPSPLNPPSGCAFRTRCPLAIERCASEIPALKQHGMSPTGVHLTACHRAGEQISGKAVAPAPVLM